MSGFWDWSNNADKSATRAATALTVEETSLAAVELYTQTAMVLGEVAPEGRRLSDILNSSSRLPVRDARSISIVHEVEGSERGGWTSLATEDILFAMPPQHASLRQMKIHRRQHRIRIGTGPYRIVGTAHVLPGMKLDPYVLRSRMRFLALTDAYVTSTTDPLWERTARVVLVNVQPLEDLTEVLTIS